jgi:hypothetical protein
MNPIWDDGIGVARLFIAVLVSWLGFMAQPLSLYVGVALRDDRYCSQIYHIAHIHSFACVEVWANLPQILGSTDGRRRNDDDITNTVITQQLPPGQLPQALASIARDGPVRIAPHLVCPRSGASTHCGFSSAVLCWCARGDIAQPPPAHIRSGNALWRWRAGDDHTTTSGSHCRWDVCRGHHVVFLRLLGCQCRGLLWTLE